jgi:hypothetical protein
MLELNLSFESGWLNHHNCNSATEGDWVVFRCPICKNYERRINRLTGETTVKNISAVVNHSGRHIPFQQTSMAANPNLN